MLNAKLHSQLQMLAKSYECFLTIIQLSTMINEQIMTPRRRNGWNVVKTASAKHAKPGNNLYATRLHTPCLATNRAWCYYPISSKMGHASLAKQSCLLDQSLQRSHDVAKILVGWCQEAQESGTWRLYLYIYCAYLLS